MLDKNELKNELLQVISLLERSILTQARVWTRTEEPQLADSIKQDVLALNSANNAIYLLNLDMLFAGNSAEETVIDE